MSRSGNLRKGDSTTASLENVKGVKGDCLKPETFPEELNESQSLVHAVGALIPGRDPNTTYEALNRDSCIKVAEAFEKSAAEQGIQKNFVI